MNVPTVFSRSGEKNGQDTGSVRFAHHAGHNHSDFYGLYKHRSGNLLVEHNLNDILERLDADIRIRVPDVHSRYSDLSLQYEEDVDWKDEDGLRLHSHESSQIHNSNRNHDFHILSGVTLAGDYMDNGDNLCTELGGWN